MDLMQTSSKKTVYNNEGKAYVAPDSALVENDKDIMRRYIAAGKRLRGVDPSQSYLMTETGEKLFNDKEMLSESASNPKFLDQKKNGNDGRVDMLEKKVDGMSGQLSAILAALNNLNK